MVDDWQMRIRNLEKELIAAKEKHKEKQKVFKVSEQWEKTRELVKKL